MANKPSYTRYRFQPGYLPQTANKRTTGPTWGSISETKYSPGEGTYRYMTDVVTPGFRRRVARRDGWVFNPLSSYSNSYNTGGTGWYIYDINTPTSWERVVGNSLPWFLPQLHYTQLYTPRISNGVRSEDLTTLENEVSTKVQSDRYRSDANVWESVAEFGKTAAMLRNPIKAFFDYDKRNREKAARVAPANAWLMYRYGIMPLVRDTQTILENHLNRISGLQPSIRTTRAKVEQTYWNETRSTATMGVLSAKVVDTVSSIVRVRAMSLDEAIWDIQQSYGLSTKQLYTLPWELVPYSFVADWFFNVGDYLGAMSESLLNHVNLGSCLTTEVEHNRVVTMSDAWQNSQTSIYRTTEWPSGYMRSVTVWKDRFPGLKAPTLVVKSDFKLGKLTRAADAFALIGQIVSRRFPDSKGIAAGYRSLRKGLNSDSA